MCTLYYLSNIIITYTLIDVHTNLIWTWLITRWTDACKAADCVDTCATSAGCAQYALVQVHASDPVECEARWTGTFITADSISTNTRTANRLVCTLVDVGTDTVGESEAGRTDTVVTTDGVQAVAWCAELRVPDAFVDVEASLGDGWDDGDFVRNDIVG